MTRRILLPLLAIIAVPGIVRAQSGVGGTPLTTPPAEARHDVRECWRFGFGVWEPALDWHASGHEGRSPAEYLASVASGDATDRSAAAPSNAAWSSAAADTALILFPDWWPAGVAVRLEPAPASADTVRGRATALVANGHAKNPVSRIVAIRRSCGPGPAR